MQCVATQCTVDLCNDEDVKFFALIELHQLHDLVDTWQHHTTGLAGSDGQLDWGNIPDWPPPLRRAWVCRQGRVQAEKDLSPGEGEEGDLGASSDDDDENAFTLDTKNEGFGQYTAIYYWGPIWAPSDVENMKEHQGHILGPQWGPIGVQWGPTGVQWGPTYSHFPVGNMVDQPGPTHQTEPVDSNKIETHDPTKKTHENRNPCSQPPTHMMTTPRHKINMQPQYKRVPHTHFSGIQTKAPKMMTYLNSNP
ncbi:hypothetical protein BS47DRAFT_1364076 [Hydnum rufescens UP504]|uniref:Uncharacterized protein n=1 Tax=Hydnum rufescens UP504 TaxID=1448309 RepID=A0A9P6ASH9_9AGAM|nr:hypothetical protein BS47DRAFT_1364076 [Hydnum rufescens UP504]